LNFFCLCDNFFSWRWVPFFFACDWMVSVFCSFELICILSDSFYGVFIFSIYSDYVWLWSGIYRRFFFSLGMIHNYCLYVSHYILLCLFFSSFIFLFMFQSSAVYFWPIVSVWSFLSICHILSVFSVAGTVYLAVSLPLLVLPLKLSLYWNSR